MMVAHLVDQYGYAAVFVGSLLEGETVLLLGGVAAHHGYLSFAVVVLLAFCGGTLGDQILFQMGRHFGTRLLKRSPSLAARSRTVLGVIQRYEAPFIVGVRFMYGLRLIGPFAIGMSKVSSVRFALLNMLGAAIWAPLIVTLGYLFGHALRWLFSDLDRYEGLAMLLVIGLALIVWLVHRVLARRRDRSL
ncbi:DedA family protein [Variovorax sp. J22R133]|uniref:DedA family protein n=1 Tax=Variovorax brevis TaxID=3053503 RepID=UPI002576C3B8|nr:DedA family protein [Variovorax sp. J22R133]MDM0111549.1 DedA family protein [Variovorax sp. J22R133]